jgi:hypothetical protein
MSEQEQGNPTAEPPPEPELTPAERSYVLRQQLRAYLSFIEFRDWVFMIRDIGNKPVLRVAYPEPDGSLHPLLLQAVIDDGTPEHLIQTARRIVLSAFAESDHEQIKREFLYKGEPLDIPEDKRRRRAK